MIPLNLDRSRSKVHPTAFIADNATIIGDVTIGAEASVWYGAVVRGEAAPITLGARTNVQDGCILHSDADFPTTIGDNCTLGHGAIVHGATVEDNVLVGIRAVVLNGAHIGHDSIVGAGAVVTEGTIIPPGSLVLGIPGKVQRQLGPADLQFIRKSTDDYVGSAKQHKQQN